MKKILALFALLLLSAGCAFSEGIRLPEGLVSIESEAFDALSCEWVFIPESCTEIAADAFSPALKKVYGYRGSAAQSFAQSTHRSFVDAGIYDVSIACSSLVLPNARVNVRASWTSAFRCTASYSLWQQGILISSSESGKLTVGESGVFDVRVTLRNDYCSRSFTFGDAIRVIEQPKMAADSFEIALGSETDILSEDEIRECTFYIKDRTIAQIKDGGLTALKRGETTLTVTVKQAGISLKASYPISVYMPVESIACAVTPFGYVGQSALLQPEVFPAEAKYRDVSYTSSNPAAVSVSADGRLTYLSVGEAMITLSTKDVCLTLATACVPRPTDAAIEAENTLIAQGGTLQMKPVLTPVGARANLAWKSSNESVATVDENGLVTGTQPGSAVITCEGSGVRASLAVTVRTAPQRVRLSADFTYLKPGKTGEIEIELTPPNTALNKIVWFSSDENVATVLDGTVTARAQGECVITAVAQSGAKDSFILHVSDYPAAIGIDLGEDRQYLTITQSKKIKAAFYPETAQAQLVWSSSDEDTVRVDEDGTVTGLAAGTAVITARSRDDEGVFASIYINVLSDTRTLAMPLRRTARSGIAENLKRIEAVRQSALTELKSLYARGMIGKTEFTRRQSILTNAFAMYAFPWMVEEEQPYWNSANSDGGVKDFQRGVVYYGLPYISGDFDFNRAYNVEKALSEQRYQPVDGEQYYLLNQEKLLVGNYVGCDCSTFVGMSYFGCNSATRSQRTGTLYYSSDFITLDRDAELYPGDIIVAGYRHVVLFLYYANASHTQIVTIEQGGSEPTVNTISASVYSLSYYYNDGYIPRRYKFG